MKRRTPKFTSRFERQLKKKRKATPQLADAVIRTVELVLTDPANPGLNLHKVDRENDIWDAYVTRAIRVTCQRDGGAVIFRNNCRHDIIDRRQW